MTRDWCCPDCCQPLGMLQRDAGQWRHYKRLIFKLVVDDRVEKVVPRTTCYIVYCPCGGYRKWTDGKIELPGKG